MHLVLPTTHGGFSSVEPDMLYLADISSFTPFHLRGCGCYLRGVDSVDYRGLTLITPCLMHWGIQGAPPARPPQQDSILSFSHIFSPKSVRVGGCPPKGKSWTCHCDDTQITVRWEFWRFYKSCLLVMFSFKANGSVFVMTELYQSELNDDSVTVTGNAASVMV